jgi:hypothetical protein
MSISMTVDYDQAKFEALARGIVAMPKQLEFATVRALKKSEDYVYRTVRKATAKELKIPQYRLGKRAYRPYIRRGDRDATLWIGTWNLDPRTLGNVRQTPRSVRVKGRNYPGAFLAKVPSSPREKIWIRRASRHFNFLQYDAKVTTRGGKPKRPNLPIVRAIVPIDHTIRGVVQRNWDDLNAYFKKRLGEEINYEVNVRGKKA